MHPLLIFLCFFGGFLAVAGLTIVIGKGLYVVAKLVERKTGSSFLAHVGVPMLFMVFMWSICCTWILTQARR